MKLLVIPATALVVALLGWTATSLYFVWDIEEPVYEVVSREEGYEIRRYAPIVVATTRAAPGDDENALFRVLAGYIFGGNEAGEAIQMTAPVLMSDESASSGLAKTADGDDPARSTMRFVMPAEISRENLPRPEDPRVRFETLPARTVAALEFSWYATNATRRSRAEELVSMLDRDGVQTAGEALYAGYQPPFSAPFLMRHEILLEVDVN